MKHILRKLHLGGGHESFDARPQDVGGRVLDPRNLNSPDSEAAASSSSSPSFVADHRAHSGLSGWLTNARHSFLPSNGAQHSSRPRVESPAGGAENAASSRLDNDPGAESPVDFKYYEEEFQVQLALALSVSNQSALDDPESLQIIAAKRISLGRPPSPGNTPAEFTAHRYWNYNVLDYEEKVVDGFYDVYGVSSDFGNSDKMPSLVDLQGIPLTDTLGYEVVLVNRAIDPDLVQLEQAALCLACDCGAGEFGPQQTYLVQKIAELVVEHMGGPVVDANDMLRRWRTRSYELRTSLNNIVLPIGCLRFGLSRHRALLFKVLADHISLPCRLVKGSYYTGTDEGAVNIVKIDNDREFIVDLMGAPGALLPAEIVGASGQLDLLETTALVEDIFSQINHTHNSSGNLFFDSRTGDNSKERLSAPGKSSGNMSGADSVWQKAGENTGEGLASELDCLASGLFHQEAWRQPPFPKRTSSAALFIESKDVSSYVMDAVNKNSQSGQHSALSEGGRTAPQELFGESSSQQSAGNAKAYDPSFRALDSAATSTAMDFVLDSSAAVQMSSVGNLAASARSPKDSENDTDFKICNTDLEEERNICGRKNEVNNRRCNDHEELRWTNNKGDPVLEDVAEWEIPWEEIVIGERIGLGSYGEVYHGDWHGTEVAVKKFLDQAFSGDALDEFIREIRIMRRMKHPNVVLFIGAVTRPPNLSIVTEYLPRGSLFRILHRPNCQLEERRRLKMALDVAKGMNYLHTSMPIIVHRDLKSPNLLVDKNWVVKVCDFGLSRMKHHTFLSSKSTAGTPEWMAPEVLRNEPSNEKCDVYSFGVILWELATVQQPWSGMNPMQVVGAVGFQNRRLEIPNNVDPPVARIISECWQSDPRLRPSFAELMDTLKPLKRLIRD